VYSDRLLVCSLVGMTYSLSRTFQYHLICHKLYSAIEKWIKMAATEWWSDGNLSASTMVSTIFCKFDFDKSPLFVILIPTNHHFFVILIPTNHHILLFWFRQITTFCYFDSKKSPLFAILIPTNHHFFVSFIPTIDKVYSNMWLRFTVSCSRLVVLYIHSRFPTIKLTESI